MSELLMVLAMQFQKATTHVKASAHSFCERHLIADDPYDELKHLCSEITPVEREAILFQARGVIAKVEGGIE